MIYWFYLSLAIIFEVIGTLSLKYASINNSPIYSTIMGVSYIISFTLLYFAIKRIDIGIAYAIWAGMGTALIVIFGAFIFNEIMSVAKVFFIICIIVGAVGLKFMSGGQ